MASEVKSVFPIIIRIFVHNLAKGEKRRKGRKEEEREGGVGRGGETLEAGLHMPVITATTSKKDHRQSIFSQGGMKENI